MKYNYLGKTGKVKSQCTEILSTENLTKMFSELIAVNKIDFHLLEGEIHGLIGENGAGKSTFIKLIDGSYVPDDGKIILRGNEVKFSSPLDACRKGIGTVYQELMLLPKLSIAENICISGFILERKKVINWKKMNQFAYNKLKELGFDYNVEEKVSNISIQQKQIVAIVRAIAQNCQILLLDEPTSSLGGLEIKVFFDFLIRLKKIGLSVIFVSHRLQEVLDICDRYTILRDGNKIGTFKKRELSHIEVITNIVGREILDYYPKVITKVSEPILKIKNLSIGNIISDISFKVNRGELLGIVGAVGSGKTEIAKVLFGAYAGKYQGDIYIKNKKITINSPIEAINKIGCCLVTEDRRGEGIFLTKSVGFNISITVLKDLYNNYHSLSFKKEQKVINESIENLNIKCSSSTQIAEDLSGGNQQKVVLAKWIAMNKINLIIFDEPTKGIDVGAKVEIYEIINQLLIKGIGVLLFSSEVLETIGISDRLLVLYRGKIVHEELRGKTGFDEHTIQKYILSGK